jgi:hypothetical protein
MQMFNALNMEVKAMCTYLNSQPTSSLYGSKLQLLICTLRCSKLSILTVLMKSSLPFAAYLAALLLLLFAAAAAAVGMLLLSFALLLVLLFVSCFVESHSATCAPRVQ